MDLWNYAVGRMPYRFDAFPRQDLQILDGLWSFAYYPPNAPTPPDNPALLARAALEGDTMPVPGNWQLHGFGKPRYINTRYTFGADSNQLQPPAIPVGQNSCGVYCRKLQLKRPSADRRMILRVGGFSASLTIWVNEQFCCYADNGRTACETDITEYVVDGENTLVFRVDEFSPGSYLECQDMWRLSGIFRSVELYTISALHLLDTYIWPELVQNTAVLHFECKLHNFSPDCSPRLQVCARLLDPNGSCAGSCRFETGSDSERFDEISMNSMDIPAQYKALLHRIPSGVTATAYGHITLENPLLWNAETPHLYTVEISTFRQEQPLEQTSFSYGIRTIAVSEQGQLLVNGQPVKLRGVNRHEFSPQNGYCVTEEEMLRDIRLMKRCNINAVRCSHYPNSPAWYRLCDQEGLYVMDEANLESHGISYRKNLLPGNDARWLPRVLDRESAMVQTNKNHACIFSWSLGNEIGFGETVAQAAAYCRTADPTRLIHKRQMNSIADMDSETYPSPAVMEQHALAKPNRPFLTNEYLHAMGNACGNLAEYWKIIYAHDNLIGGFIWEWCDHGLSNGQGGYLYGGDFGEAYHDENFCIDGITTPDRTFTPKMQEVKQVYAPVCLYQSEDGQSFVAANRTSFTPLTSFIGQLRLMADGAEIFRQSFRLPAAAPGCCASFHPNLPPLPPEDGRELQLLLEIYRRGETEPCSFGQFLLRQGSIHRPVCSAGTIAVECTAEEYVLQMERGYRAYISQTDGRMRLVQGAKTIFDQWGLCVFRAPTDNDAHSSLVLGQPNWFSCGLPDLQPVCTGIKLEQISRNRVQIYWVCDYTGTGCRFTLSQRAEFYSNGQMFIDCALSPQGELPWLGRVGIQARLPLAFSQVSLYGKGPLETYPDRQTGGVLQEISFRASEQPLYIRPQTYGAHEKSRSIVLSDGSTWLRAQGGCAMSMGVSCWEETTLWKIRHAFSLPAPSHVYLHLDYVQGGLGNKSCGPDPLPAYRVLPTEMHFGFLLTPSQAPLAVTGGSSKPAGFSVSDYLPWRSTAPDAAAESYRDPSDPDMRSAAGMV